MWGQDVGPRVQFCPGSHCVRAKAKNYAAIEETKKVGERLKGKNPILWHASKFFWIKIVYT